MKHPFAKLTEQIFDIVREEFPSLQAALTDEQVILGDLGSLLLDVGTDEAWLTAQPRRIRALRGNAHRYSLTNEPTQRRRVVRDAVEHLQRELVRTDQLDAGG